ncbi:MAG: hypothetical protein CRN43_21180 [Candidatus Nephrothrix sp. EaCA]|nr:MAG: hypothetical protein CRN43_21180 [Candidatus Nephrothrix sp. EaCA]
MRSPSETKQNFWKRKFGKSERAPFKGNRKARVEPLKSFEKDIEKINGKKTSERQISFGVKHKRYNLVISRRPPTGHCGTLETLADGHPINH